MDRLGFISYIDAFIKEPQYRDPPDYASDDIHRDLSNIENEYGKDEQNFNWIILAGVITVALVLSKKV